MADRSLVWKEASVFESAILDVAIGLILVYLILSLLCLTVNEFLASLLHSRARNLERGLEELLQDPEAVKDGLVARLYRHPLIDGLYQGDYGDTSGRKAILPSYIPARSFALALIDLIQPGQPVLTTATTTPATPASPSAAPSPGSVAALREALLTNPVFQSNPDLTRTLTALIDAAGDDVIRVRLNIEDWYNSAMDAFSGWYKRRTQYIVLALGLVLTILVNADTFAIGNALARNKALREALVKGASDYEAVVQKAQAGASGAAGQTPSQWLETKVAGLEPIGLPIGWRPEDLRNPSYLAAAIPGWLLTAFAVSLGAPFWFDLLNRVMIIRSTVKPREKSREQGPRD